MNNNKLDMKKYLKYFLSIIFILAILFIYHSWKDMNKMKEAQKMSDYIIEHLDDKNVYTKFSDKYFKKDILKKQLNYITQKCNWKNRRGKFVDFFTQKSIGGKDKISFIYEYYLDCDSLRFILTFDMEGKPEIMSFYVEPLEVNNPMIVDPSKQLK